MSPEDADVPGSESVYRRVPRVDSNFMIIDQVTHEIVGPTTAAFQVDPKDNGISVYRRSILLDHNLSAEDLIKDPLNLVVGVTVDDLRSCRHILADGRVVRLGLRNDPWPEDVPDPKHPRNAAHALIVGFDGLSKGDQRMLRAALVRQPTMRIVHEG